MQNRHHENSKIERALKSNFQNIPSHEVPEGWRQELKAKVDQVKIEEEMLFFKYEKIVWRISWASLAASIFIILGLSYSFNAKNTSLQDAVNSKICEYMETYEGFQK